MNKLRFSTQLSPRRLGLLFFLDKKQKQKNQGQLMQHTNAAPTSHYLARPRFFARQLVLGLSVSI